MILIKERTHEMKYQKKEKKMAKKINRCCLYICQLNVKPNSLRVPSDMTGKMVFKIGSTQNLPERKNGLKQEFGCTLKMIADFEADRNHQLERFVHSHPLMVQHKVKVKVSNVRYSSETYAFSNKYLLGTVLPFLLESQKIFRYSESTLAEIKRLNDQIAYLKGHKEARCSSSISEPRAMQMNTETSSRHRYLLRSATTECVAVPTRSRVAVNMMKRPSTRDLGFIFGKQLALPAKRAR